MVPGVVDAELKAALQKQLKSDDFWRTFRSQLWTRFRKSAWATIAGTVTALAVLTTLVQNGLQLWDRFVGASSTQSSVTEPERSQPDN